MAESPLWSIVIGPSAGVHTQHDRGEGNPGDSGSIWLHWRRGHFRRILCGEQRSESRRGWIKPVLVNAAEAFGAAKAKPYLMR